MTIFKNKKSKKPETVVAQPPIEEETKEESEHIEALDTDSPPTTSSTPDVPEEPTPDQTMIREVPVCVSKEQIWTMIIENNMMLKELLAISAADK